MGSSESWHLENVKESCWIWHILIEIEVHFSSKLLASIFLQKSQSTVFFTGLGVFKKNSSVFIAYESSKEENAEKKVIGFTEFTFSSHNSTKLPILLFGSIFESTVFYFWRIFQLKSQEFWSLRRNSHRRKRKENENSSDISCFSNWWLSITFPSSYY